MWREARPLTRRIRKRGRYVGACLDKNDIRQERRREKNKRLVGPEEGRKMAKETDRGKR